MSRAQSPGIAGRVKAARKLRNCSRPELAARIGLSERTLARRESGELPFTADEISRIATALDIKPSLLIPDEFTAAGFATADERDAAFLALAQHAVVPST